MTNRTLWSQKKGVQNFGSIEQFSWNCNLRCISLKCISLRFQVLHSRNKTQNMTQCQRGGFIFNPKIYIADFGNFKQGFLIMHLIQNSNFRAQGMFFQQLYCNTFVLHLYLEIMCMHFILSSHHISSHICNHICHKKLQYNFQK